MDQPKKQPATSRICIKNLPKHVTMERFRAHFSTSGEITDAKLLQTKRGLSRCMGFIGFKNEKQAKHAVRYFNNSFFDTSRISVEFAQSVGDDAIARPWSKYSEGSSEFDRRHEIKQEKTKRKREENQEDSDKNDPRYIEFMELMKPRSTRTTWENNTIASTIKPTKKKFKDSDDEDEVEDTKEEQTNQSEQIEIKQDPVVFNQTVSDLDYLKSRQTLKDDSDEEDEEMTEVKQEIKQEEKNTNFKLPDSNTLESSRSAKKPKIEKEEVKVQEPEQVYASATDTKEEVNSGRLFVRNLAFSITEIELKALFSRFGTIREIHIPIDAESKKTKGIAFVQFTSPASAGRCLTELDGSIFQGRLLHLLPAKQLFADAKPGQTGNQNVKQKREDLKKERSQGEKSWNSLFMRNDATVTSISNQMNLSKSSILDPMAISAGDMAVRVALGETQIINDTKEMLLKAGVCLDSLGNHNSQGIQRSNTTLLVKNIPFETELIDLRNLFGKYGDLARVVLPPAKTIALVEYSQPNDAKQSFQQLSYRKFKNVPIYLEWAPISIFKTAPTSESIDEIVTKVQPREMSAQEIEDNATSSIYVRNLNFNTQEAELKKIFDAVGNVRRVTIPKAKNSKGVAISVGYGFVEFSTRDEAVKAIKDLDGHVLDNHALQLSLSTRANRPARQESRRSTIEGTVSTKLVIRNVAFEVQKKDITQLFKPFGQIKSIRIPTKFDKTSRGFAFVEYMTTGEASSAIDALKNTHLYGRKLVIEYESSKSSVEDAKEKTKKFFEDRHTK